ncbi:gamma-glutamylcyclotransferase family protein [Chloroflexota bacterium]
MYYFAYGSNLSFKQMSERCPKSKPRFKAILPNYRLIFTGWSRKLRGGVAGIKKVKDEKVVGGVYEVSEGCLMSLDRHEGSLYVRLNVVVFTEDGDPIEAITHIKEGKLEETQPSQEYLTIMRQGFKDWKIA